ncbi:zeta toxin family protein, partial [Sinorhizobium medicae]
MRPSLVLLAGPNGAGKSTLYQTRVAPRFAGPFVKADIIQRKEIKDASTEASYKAAEVARDRRAELFGSGKSFATGTVFSHPSKLEIIEEARSRGYIVIVMHVGVESPDLSVARVKGPVGEGGHDVPEEKIRTRYTRGQPLIRKAILRSDRGMVFDNSRLNEPPRQVLAFA